MKRATISEVRGEYMGLVYTSVPIKKKHGKWCKNKRFIRVLNMLTDKCGYKEGNSYLRKRFNKEMVFPRVRKHKKMMQFGPSERQLSSLRYVKDKLPKTTDAYLLAIFDILVEVLDDVDLSECVKHYMHLWKRDGMSYSSFCLMGIDECKKTIETNPIYTYENYPDLNVLLDALEVVDLKCSEKGWYDI